MAEVGRPTKLTPEVRKKIEEAAAIDASVEEICFYAGISKPTLYNWFKADPEFFNRIQALRQKPILAARQEVVKGITGNPSFALNYLARKKPAEFSEKTKVEHSGSVLTNSDPANEKNIEAIVDRFEVELRDAIVNEKYDDEESQGEKPSTEEGAALPLGPRPDPQNQAGQEIRLEVRESVGSDRGTGIQRATMPDMLGERV